MANQFLSSGDGSGAFEGTEYSQSGTSLNSLESPGMSRSEMLGRAQAAAGGVKALSIFMQAGIEKSNLDAAMSSLRAQRDERQVRHNTNVRLLRKQARKAVSSQKEAFIAGGVKLEGSAIDVVNDTLMDLLNAELNKEREQAFINEQSAIEEANLRSRRESVDTVAAINATSSILGSTGGFQ